MPPLDELVREWELAAVEGRHAITQYLITDVHLTECTKKQSNNWVIMRGIWLQIYLGWRVYTSFFVNPLLWRSSLRTICIPLTFRD